MTTQRSCTELRFREFENGLLQAILKSAVMNLGHFVYALRCSDGSLYIGYTTDPERRQGQHNKGVGSRYTRSRRPVALLRQWAFATRGEALRFEYALKQLSKGEKEG